MTDQATNAGAETVTAPISGGDATTTTAAPSFKEAYAAAQAELSGKGKSEVKAGETRPAGKDDGNAQPPATLEAPKRWTDERKQLFAQQPREVQEAMLTLGKEWETGYGKKFEELAGQRKLAEGVQALLTPELREQARKAGLDDVGAVGRLVEMQKLYNADPQRYIGMLLKHSGIDPKIFIADQTAQRALEPHLRPLVDEIQTLRQSHAAILNQRDETSMKSAIAEFTEAKDEAGSPAYPHLERVVNDMAEIILNDPRINAMGSTKDKLKAAYDMAVFGNTEIRAELISAEAQKRAAALEAERANGALKQAATTKPAAGSTDGRKTGKLSIRDAYAEARRELKL